MDIGKSRRVSVRCQPIRQRLHPSGGFLCWWWILEQECYDETM